VSQLKEIVLSVRVRRSRPRPDNHVQLDFLDQLFAGEPVVVKAAMMRTVKVYRPTAGLLARYRGLADIAPDEWLDFFPQTGDEWSREDQEYLIAWWGKDDVMSLAYALGRPPWGLQREVCRLRREGWRIEYLREDKLK